jgi:hypothetical protein
VSSRSDPEELLNLVDAWSAVHLRAKIGGIVEKTAPPQRRRLVRALTPFYPAGGEPAETHEDADTWAEPNLLTTVPGSRGSSSGLPC